MREVSEARMGLEKRGGKREGLEVGGAKERDVRWVRPSRPSMLSHHAVGPGARVASEAEGWGEASWACAGQA